MKIALAMIVRGTAEEAQLLDRLLDNVSEYVDGIFIVGTYEGSPSEAMDVERIARKHKANFRTWQWTQNFGAARQFSFDGVPKDYDYIFWSDADDMWRGLEKLKPTIESHPETDAFAVEYLYSWDEDKKPLVVHRKTMVIKNDNAAHWVGAIHEDLEPLRSLDVRFIDGIERLHLSTPERFKENAERNVEISKRELAKAPEDPRTYWNLANSQYGVAAYEDAMASFAEFLKVSESDDEKYLAHTRLADVFRALNNPEGAIKELLIAIGMRPMFPEAYFQLAYLYFSDSNYDKAEEYCIQGLMRRPQVSRMIVYNPRDYDYNPLMLLAQIYYHKNRPDLMLPLLEGCLKIYPKDKYLKQLVQDGRIEKRKLGRALTAVKKLRRIRSAKRLNQAISELPLDIRSHPSVVMLRNKYVKKEESSGRDLTIYCGNTTHQWYDGSDGFIGGSEEAVIYLSRELVKLGWNVTVYNNCGHTIVAVNGVTYRPFWEWNYRDKQDVVIIWRYPRVLDADINSPRVYLDVHDAIPAAEFTQKRLARLTKAFVKTKFHRSLYENVPDHQIAVIPNGIDFSLFKHKPKKDPYLLINTSSPDRSLDVLPDLFAEVKKQVPKARLLWAYGWDLFKTSYARDRNKMAWMADVQAKMQQVDIEDLGRLSQTEVAALYQRASILAYPTEFAEIDCISVKKAQLAGCYPITSDFGALAESIKWGFLVHSPKTKLDWNKPYQFHFGLEHQEQQEAWVRATVRALKESPTVPDISFDQWRWDTVAAEWHTILCA